MPEQAQPNKPLSGAELAEIIIKDIRSVLEQDGMLTQHIAYNKAAYSVTVKIMTANPIIPDWKNRVRSKNATLQQIEGNEAMAAMKAFPMQPEPEDEVITSGTERTRQIISPNQSRIENDMAVPITFRGPDGDMKEEKVMYDVDMLPDDGGFPDGVTDRDLSEAETKSED